MYGARGPFQSDSDSRNFGSLGGLMRAWNGPMEAGPLVKNHSPAGPIEQGAFTAAPIGGYDDRVAAGLVCTGIPGESVCHFNTHGPEIVRKRYITRIPKAVGCIGE